VRSAELQDGPSALAMLRGERMREDIIINSDGKAMEKCANRQQGRTEF
jgi:hypothetical protein